MKHNDSTNWKQKESYQTVKLTKKEKEVLLKVDKFGWTFKGDAMFRTFQEAERVLHALENKALFERRTDSYGGSFHITELGREEAMLVRITG